MTTRNSTKGGVVDTKDTRKSVQFSKTDRRKSALIAANGDTKYVTSVYYACR